MYKFDYCAQYDNEKFKQKKKKNNTQNYTCYSILETKTKTC